MYELIITEKPAASLKIATALADKTPIKKMNKKVPYYELTHKGKKIVVACAVGHLYSLSEKEKSGWTYPSFEIEWKLSSEINKASKFTKEYSSTIKQLTKNAEEFTVATDYDLEGEVIGLNIIRFICKKKDAKRMKFSTLTKEELVSSYEKASKHLNWEQAEAGETRHFLDWLWGINSSRALTLSIKDKGYGFKILSSGRVQGPTLKIIVDKEKEIQSFNPVPFWQIELLGLINKQPITASHKKDKIWKKEEAQDIIKNTKDKKAFISKLTKKEFKQLPPNPFDLTALQLEAYKCINTTPKQTLEIAQELYTASYISYPRTSSNQLPPSINYKKILTELSKQKEYSPLIKELLKKPLKPNNGNKNDPAHPAIYPTGIIPQNLSGKSKQLYDLIIKRTLATFSTSAKRQTVTIEIDVNKELFVVTGTTTLEEGWHKFYKPYLKLKEQELPIVKEKQEVNIKKIILYEKETQPPKRFTQASIIKELEKRSLGTKATRANIVDALYQRNYIENKTIKATNLGIKITETLEKYVPEIVDEALTRHFEEDMEKIQEKKKKEKEVLEEAKKELVIIFKRFKENEAKIGEALSQANKQTITEQNLIGECPVCKKGELRIIYSKKTKSKFIACNKYPDCKTTFSIPQNALVKPCPDVCESCKFPQIMIIRKGRRPFIYCLNPNCPKKKEWLESNN